MASLLCLIPGAAFAYDYAKDFPGIQAAFNEFPLFKPATDDSGGPAFQTLALKHPVAVNGKKYFGFRFTVPTRANHEDLVWSFVSPLGAYHWYIVPESGTMTGFSNYFTRSRGDYMGTNQLFPMNGKDLILQRLSGRELEDGRTYVIWFNIDKNLPARISVAFTFTHMPLENDSETDAIEKLFSVYQRSSPPIVNPANGHTYILLRQATWKQSEARAVALGGHLATVRNQAEEDWLVKTFGKYGGSQRHLWIGLNDMKKKFHFSWSSGESVSYTCWAPGEPNNAGRGEDFVGIYFPRFAQGGKWNDWNDRTADPMGLPMNGVVEIVPKTEKTIAPTAGVETGGRRPATFQSTAPATAAQPSADVSTASMAAIDIRPSLVITNDSGVIKLQWPLALGDHMLEATTDLAQPFTMFGYSEATNAEAGLVYATITNPLPQMFFRLRKP